MRNRVRELREKMSLTQEELAKLCDLKYQPRVAEIESGKVSPTYNTMLKISKVLKYPVDKIFLP